jgi:hypothetical protein
MDAFLPIPLRQLKWRSQGLVRPECVLALADGRLLTADWRGGICEIRPDGTQRLRTAARADGLPLRPNGIALAADGGVLMAQLGERDGGIWRLAPDDRLEPWLMTVDGQALPPTNFVLPRAGGGAWVTVSTCRQPRALGYRRDGGDGFIVAVDAAGAARIVADGLGYTNEVAVHPRAAGSTSTKPLRDGCRALRCAPTARSATRRWSPPSMPAPFPDGLAFDEEGQCLGGQHRQQPADPRRARRCADLWLEDADPAHLAWVEAAYEAGTMGRQHLDGAAGRVLQEHLEHCLHRRDRRTAVLGCLLGDRLATLRLPVAGARPCTGTSMNARKSRAHVRWSTPRTEQIRRASSTTSGHPGTGCSSRKWRWRWA